jgi:hypothetical protein
VLIAVGLAAIVVGIVAIRRSKDGDGPPPDDEAPPDDPPTVVT